MNDRDALVATWVRVATAYNLIADVRERHHHDGEFLTTDAELTDLAHRLFRWLNRLDGPVCRGEPYEVKRK